MATGAPQDIHDTLEIYSALNYFADLHERTRSPKTREHFADPDVADAEHARIGDYMLKLAQKGEDVNGVHTSHFRVHIPQMLGATTLQYHTDLTIRSSQWGFVDDGEAFTWKVDTGLGYGLFSQITDALETKIGSVTQGASNPPLLYKDAATGFRSLANTMLAANYWIMTPGQLPQYELVR